MVCSYGKFQPVGGWIQETQPKWWNINLYYLRLSELRGPYSWSGNTYKTKIIPFSPLSGESEAILSKMFRPGHRAKVFIWENFHPRYRFSKTEISVTGPVRPLIWTHRYFYKEKSGEARSRKPSQPGWPGSYEEAVNHVRKVRKWCSHSRFSFQAISLGIFSPKCRLVLFMFFGCYGRPCYFRWVKQWREVKKRRQNSNRTRTIAGSPPLAGPLAIRKETTHTESLFAG